MVYRSQGIRPSGRDLFFALVIILIVQRIGTQESNIFNNVTIENELEWRLNDNNIYTVRSRHTHTKANTVINHYGEKYTSKERHHEITVKFSNISRFLSQEHFPIFVPIPIGIVFF